MCTTTPGSNSLFKKKKRKKERKDSLQIYMELQEGLNSQNSLRKKRTNVVVSTFYLT
jgi:hypothetical protein